MKKILSIFGTRPEAIKMAPIIHKLKDFPNDFESKVCVTGQHREMLDQVLDLFEISADFDLNIMKSSQTLTNVTCNVLIGLDEVFKLFEPDIVLVHGDTTTTMAACIASYYNKIQVYHIEAGLRTGNIYSPWPEEVNRCLASVICNYHFAPTQNAMDNLLNEGVSKNRIFITGNTVIDALKGIVKRIEQDKTLLKSLENNFSYLNRDKKIILVTGHRRENFGEGFENICEALKMISEINDDVEIVYPVHLNPNVQSTVNRILGNNDKIHLIDPLDYLPFVYMMNISYLIITDSGGVQEEAPSLGKPVLLIRDTTERPEAVDAGTVKLVGKDKNKIILETKNLLEDKDAYESMAKKHNPYGDGKAANRIVSTLLNINE
jgi:UDP-N-acetylglucosamine 2-epimerase (non-hydrolysing)